MRMLFAFVGILFPLALHASEPTGVCDDPRLVGMQVDSPSDDMEELCGIDEPVQITEVSGIELSQTLFVDCTAAVALANLIDDSIVPMSFNYFKEAPIKIGLGNGYQCRKRRDGQGIKISEHALGRAVDIMGFEFEKKEPLSVLEGWKDKRRKDYKFLRSVSDAACGIFTTSLSPDTNAQHLDHMHFDTKPRRSPWCE